MFNRNNQYQNNQFQNDMSSYPSYNSSSRLDNFNTTNIVKVTSLDEAIMRTVVRPSDMVYFNQGKDEFYNVRVDMNGNKSWQTFTFTVPNNDEDLPVRKSDLAVFDERLKVLEDKIKVVPENG